MGDKKEGQPYAVKNMRTSESASLVATRECDVAKHIRLKPHPCIVKLHIVQNFEDCGIYALVMEFASGGDLTSRILQAKMDCKSRNQPYKEVVETMGWIGQIFLGLEHLHIRMETLLRDLKADNMVLTATGQAKLTDFGFGRIGTEPTKKGWSFGMPTG